jgi:hypothetical protein
MKDSQTNRRMDGRMDGRMDERMDGRMDGRMDRVLIFIFHSGPTRENSKDFEN